MKINIFFILRCLVAVVFIISGTEKLMNPVENFIYVIQGYDIIHNADLEDLIAQVFPWIELLTGAFLLLGLWTKLSLLATGAMAGGFVIFVGQAITRKLPLSDCGCFGDLAHFPIWVTFVIDWAILILSIILYIKADRASQISLDRKLD